MNPKWMKRWERKRAKGKARFLVVQFITLYPFYIAGPFLGDLVKGGPISIPNIAFFISGFPIIIVLNFMIWLVGERKYKKAIAAQPQEEEPTESE